MADRGCHARVVQLVGRVIEMSAIAAALDDVAAGGSRVLLLVGESGIGKTRLLDLASRKARRRDFEIIGGRATEHEADVPFALFGDATWAATSPTLAAEPPALPRERWQLFRSLVTGFDRAEHASPLLLALDDVHWADPASLELVDMLLRRPPAGAHLLMLGLRPGRTAHVLTAAARSAGRSVESLELTPLSPEEAADLLPGRTSEDRTLLYAASGGNPLLLNELQRVGPGSPTPQGVVASVGSEVRQLSAPGQALVRAGAIVGDPFLIDVAARTAALHEDEWAGPLDELLDRGLVESADSPRHFRFRHPIVRSAVHDAMTPGERLQHHRRAAEVLAGTHATAESQAHHLVHSAAPGDRGAASTLRAAAATVRGRAPSIAADWLFAAKRVDPPQEPGQLGDLARVLVQSGRLAEALAVAEEGLTFGDAAGDDMLAVTLVAASVERQLGRHESARRRLVRAVETRAGPTTRPELLAALALSAYEAGDYRSLAVWAEQLHASASHDRVLRAAGDAILAMVRRFEADVTTSARHADLALDSIRNATDEELSAHGELVTPIPWALVAIERFGSAAETSRRAAAATRSAGNLSAAVSLALPEVLALALMGRLRAADEAAQQVELTARLTHNDQATQWALWVRAWVLLERGHVTRALAAARESVQIGEELDDSALVTVARTVLGSVLLADGRAQEAAALLAGYDVEPTWICRWSPRLVEALLATGQDQDARAAAERAVALAEASGLHGALSGAHRAAGLVALAAGERQRASTHARAAVESATAIGADHDLALAHLLAGRCAEQQEGKVGHFRQAHGLALACDAGRTREESVRELRRLGRRIGRGGARAPGDQGVASLSLREREIADLVGEGRTNREIADRLFLSQKTVESHLSKAFDKLGVTSRAALAVAVAQAGRPGGVTGE